MSHKQALWLGIAILIVIGGFLGLAQWSSPLGFPLDDAWIHQTYARHFAENGRWEFVPGIASSGSTAPLWTLLLAVGYWLRIPYLLWAYLLGIAALFGTIHFAMVLWQQLWPDFGSKTLYLGLLLVFTWPLLWAALSGMETLLFAALGLALLAHFGAAQWRYPFRLGLLSGLLMLTRPDGLVLICIILLGFQLESSKSSSDRGAAFGRQERLRSQGLYLLGAVLLLVPYFAFNWWSSGHIWPTTFYAKQSEYAFLLAAPLPARFFQLSLVSLGSSPTGGMSSPHLLLLPGVVMAVVTVLRKRAFYQLMPLLWAVGHLALYAWRLPLTYQHGRYLLPILPIWVMYGFAGWLYVWARLRENGRIATILRQTAVISYAAIALLFTLQGGQAYAHDVAFIESEMVATAHWLAANTPEDVLIATHDIGAIGYFTKRPLLDLAGLLTPEVVPLLGSQTAVLDYALAQQADYLVTAPGWPYEGVEQVGTAVFTTNYAWTVAQKQNNMTVYDLGTSD